MNPKGAKFVLGVGILALSFGVSLPLRAQVAGASLSGIVTGTTGAAVGKAKVSIKNLSTGEVTETQTSSSGLYTVPNLMPGDYEVSVSAEGFIAKASKVTVAAGAQQTLNVALERFSINVAEPSLEDLGITPAQVQGSAQMQARLDKRSHMLQIHQRLGLIAAGPLLASVITSPGAKCKRGRPCSATGREVHTALGLATTDLYFTSAYFAIRAPKIPGTQVRGPIRVHKALAWIHGPGMVLTPILGAIAYSQESRGERVHGIAKFHSTVAWVTVAAYGASILSVSFKF